MEVKPHKTETAFGIYMTGILIPGTIRANRATVVFDWCKDRKHPLEHQDEYWKRFCSKEKGNGCWKIEIKAVAKQTKGTVAIRKARDRMSKYSDKQIAKLDKLAKIIFSK
jgi:hypothetical protein